MPAQGSARPSPAPGAGAAATSAQGGAEPVGMDPALPHHARMAPRLSENRSAPQNYPLQTTEKRKGGVGLEGFSVIWGWGCFFVVLLKPFSFP